MSDLNLVVLFVAYVLLLLAFATVFAWWMLRPSVRRAFDDLYEAWRDVEEDLAEAFYPMVSAIADWLEKGRRR